MVQRKWINKKIKEKDKKTIDPIRKNLEIIQNSDSINLTLVVLILNQIKNLPKIRCYRKELFSDMCKALEIAGNSRMSVYESMKKIKNRKRRASKRIKGKVIGTTLLVKGLEFETVVVLNAHKFKDRQNFYVAITRASKKLIIFTNKNTLKFT